MNKATIALACMLYAVTNSVLFAEQDDSYDHDASSYDRDTSYDYGTGSYDRDAERDSGWSGTSGRDGTGRMYSDRDREGSDWYGQRSQRGSYRDDGRTWGDDMSRDRSAWRQGRYDQGYGRQSEFDQDGGYDQSRYGYMGSDGYDDWRLRDRDSGRRGYDQRSGQDWDQDRRFSDRDWRGDSYAQGRQQRGMGGGQSVAILGQLTNENASISGVNPNNKVIELRTQSGSTICVDLGPSDQTQKLNLSQNQSLFARGQLTNISGQRVLRAQEIAKVSERITLNRSQGGSGQIYGFQNGTMGSQGQSGQTGQTDKSRSQSEQSDSDKWKSPGTSGQSGASGSSQSGQSGTSGTGTTGSSGSSGTTGSTGSTGSSGSTTGSTGSTSGGSSGSSSSGGSTSDTTR